LPGHLHGPITGHDAIPIPVLEGDYGLPGHLYAYFGGYDVVKGSDQRENRRFWSDINTKYLVWGFGDGHSFVL
jgi:hypothetical protein